MVRAGPLRLRRSGRRRRTDGPEDVQPEGQAQIIQELWKARHGASTDARKNPFTAGYVEDLRRLVEGAGIGTKAPRGKTLASTIDGVVARVVNVVVDLGG